MHGDLDSLERANGVRKSDVWFLLNGTYCFEYFSYANSTKHEIPSDFSMVLATILASLSNFLKLRDSDLSMLDVMGEGDEHINLEDDKIAADIPAEKAESNSGKATSDRGRVALPTVSTSQSSSKKKVANSWEDEDLDEVKDFNSTSGATEETLLGEANSRSVDEVEEGFLNVYRALSKLRVEFDTKFKAIFA